MSNPNDYTVGWICAIFPEYVAAQAFLDETHEGPEYVSTHDNNDYTLGKIGKHNVVIAVLPHGEYGLSSAASVARDMLHTFSNVRIGLMVGIGGGAPSPDRDIRLGDVVVSTSVNGKAAVFQYDFGKTIQGLDFQETGFLNIPPTVLRTAVSGLMANYEVNGHQLDKAIHEVLERKPRLRSKYQRPDLITDRLYRPTVVHPADRKDDCSECCGNTPLEYIPRNTRSNDEDQPAIHHGVVASANKLMKDAVVRDALIAKHDVLCFDMESAGLVNHFPCLVIRGICDYSDSHKNNMWQGYAAMTAAAYAKDLLYKIPQNKIEAESKLSQALSAVQQDVSRLLHLQRSREHEDILAWISPAPIDYASQQNDHYSRRHPGTGQWLLDSMEIQTWLNIRNKTLYCPGIPGAGKTVLTSTVINHLCNTFSTSPDIGIAYIYCSFQNQDIQKIGDLLQALVKQLSQARSSLPDSIQSLYEKHKKNGTRPSYEEIIKALRSVTAMYSRVFFVVDALDECQVSGGCRRKLLAEIFDLQARYGANIFATSRPLPEISAGFNECLSINIHATKEDIWRYLDGHMVDLRSFIQDDTQLQQEIKAGILEAVDGMFLLAHIYLRYVGDQLTVTAVKTALDSFRTQRKTSKGDMDYLLSTAYDNAVDRINRYEHGLKENAIKVLLWITCAKRPLTTFELRHALATDVDKNEVDLQSIADIGDLVSICAGLVTVDNESSIVRLIHHTTRQYLDRKRKEFFPRAHSDITAICVAYLSFPVFDGGFCETHMEFTDRLKLNPLYDYASQNWGHHAREAAAPCPRILQFLEAEKKVESSSQVLMARESLGILNALDNQSVPRRMTGLHLAAYFGLDETARAVFEKHQSLDSRDTYGRTPLLYAAAKGRLGVVKLLLEKGVNITATEKYGRTPLSLASQNGNEIVVLELLTNGASIRAADKNGHSALWWACYNGHIGVVKLLREHGADAHEMDKHGQTPLSTAALNGHEAVAMLLLANGVNFNSTEQNSQLELCRAAEHGHKAVAMLLLESGVHVNAIDRFGSTALEIAAGQGHEAMVLLLLEKGANINAIGNSSKTPLFHAAESGHEAVARLLLQRGADYELADNKGVTPLAAAAKQHHETLIMLLLEMGANVNTRDNRGQTRLLSAAEDSLTGKANDTLRLLLDHGENLDVNTRDDYGRTPLSWATGNWNEPAVKLLLADDRVDVNALDNNGTTPLGWVVGFPGWILRKAPFSTHWIENRDFTLQVMVAHELQQRAKATQYKSGEVIIQLLLEKKATINTTDEEGWTPLLWAAKNGYYAITKLLIEKGADTAIASLTERTPLFWVTDNAHTTFIRQMAFGDPTPEPINILDLVRENIPKRVHSPDNPTSYPKRIRQSAGIDNLANVPEGASH